MNPLDALVEPRKLDLLICFCDIVNFTAVARATPEPLDVFRLLSGMASLMAGLVAPTNGRIIKFIGDSALIVFPETNTDEGVRLLLDMKSRMEHYLAQKGSRCTVRFQLHVGEAAVGRFGDTGAIDVMGDAVNVTARLGSREDRGMFVISPQAFRKLEPNTRKLFHRFTPPIVYVAKL